MKNLRFLAKHWGKLRFLVKLVIKTLLFDDDKKIPYFIKNHEIFEKLKLKTTTENRFWKQ